MKKIYSLINANMSSDMNIFKIRQKGRKKNNMMFPIILSILFMFAIWTNTNVIFEEGASFGLQPVILSIFVFMISIMTIIEGVYKTGPLLFNCKDDQLLLSLPISRRVVLFVRIFKFYIFELIFNSLFLLPLIISYVGHTDNVEWTFFLTSFVMIVFLPVIPIIISCIIGGVISSISSRFKFKNLAQIVLPILVFLLVFYISFNFDSMINYLTDNASSINEIISKIYYPAGLYCSLASNFNLFDLIVFIFVNVILFIVMIYILGKVYFKINSRLKGVTTTKKVKIDNLVIKSRRVYYSLIKKELNMYFKTPVFIVNSGFSLVLFVIASILLAFKYDFFISFFEDTFLIELFSNITVLILILIIASSFMTSITNSLISLEGRNINILKSLPVKTKTILMSKVLSCLVITSPMLLVCVMLVIRFSIGIIDSLLLLILCILTPLVSHFIGLLVNLKYPKLDAENSAEVVKQSISSFISVLIGIFLLILNVFVVSNFVNVDTTILLLIVMTIYILIDLGLYFLLVTFGVKMFDKLSV